MFIVFEGLDGSGKTTQIELLHRLLVRNGIDALLVREPGSTPIGEQLRRVLHDGRNAGMTPLCEMLIYAAARAQLMATVIMPALNEGRVVLCDRFVPSSIAYQVYGRDGNALGNREAQEKFTYFVNDVVTRYNLPTAVIYLDLPISEAMARRRGDNAQNYLDAQGEAFYKRVKDGYTAVSNHSDWGGEAWHVVDAVGTVDEVHGRVVAAFERIYTDEMELPRGSWLLSQKSLDALGANIKEVKDVV